MANTKKLKIVFNHEAKTAKDILSKKVMADEDDENGLKAKLAIIIASKVLEERSPVSGVAVLALSILGDEERISISYLAETLYGIDEDKLSAVGKLFMINDMLSDLLPK